MYGEKPTFTYDFISSIELAIGHYDQVAPDDRKNDPDCRRAFAVTTALRGITRADEVIQDQCRRLTERAADIITQQKAGLSIYESHVSSVQNSVSDLARAQTERELHWHTLAAILTASDLATIHAAASYPNKPKPANALDYPPGTHIGHPSETGYHAGCTDCEAGHKSR
jgi:hypothetical protein